MKFPSAKHPIWRIAGRGLVLCFCLWAYYNKMDIRDVYTIASLMFADGAMNLLKGKEDEPAK